MILAEKNKLIAEFMGYKLARCNRGHAWERPTLSSIHDDLELHGRLWRKGDSYYKWHSSWDWLMPVVEKIEDGDDDDFRILASSAEVTTYDGDIIVEMVTKGTKIEAVYECAIAYIQWYNENKP